MFNHDSKMLVNTSDDLIPPIRSVGLVSEIHQSQSMY
jgi:hypothetical protein